MSSENPRGHKEALPYFIAGLTAAILGCGIEIALSFSHPILNFIIMTGGSYAVVDGALYFFGTNGNK